ncbi:MAG: hypothetical protein RLZZ142_241 [Verrucomicrobiota bacterium]
MICAVMQPYLFPYLGYFQLASAVDRFVLCDDFQYTRKGWMNRNRFLQNGHATLFTVPLKADARDRDIREREVAAEFEGGALLRRFRAAYLRAPFLRETLGVVEAALQCESRNLFDFLEHTVRAVCSHLGIGTPLGRTSDLAVSAEQPKEERLLALCRNLGATQCINPIGGVKLYDKERFARDGVELRFLESQPFVYPQFGGEFVPSLSIVDVLMFNSLERVRTVLRTGYALV